RGLPQAAARRDESCVGIVQVTPDGRRPRDFTESGFHARSARSPEREAQPQADIALAAGDEDLAEVRVRHVTAREAPRVASGAVTILDAVRVCSLLISRDVERRARGGGGGI